MEVESQMDVLRPERQNIKDRILALPLSCFVCEQSIYPPTAIGILSDP